MRKRGYDFLGPDKDKSEAHVFKIEGDYLRIPLTKMKNIGNKKANKIIRQRQQQKII